MKFLRAMIASAIFLLLAIFIYYIHITYFKVNVIFYAAILDGVIAAVLAGFLIFIISYFNILVFFEKVQLMVIWLLVGYCLAISIPTVIDRSLSFYILEKLHQRGGGIKLDGFEEVFTKEYVKEYRLVDVRITEQIESGTIIVENGCVKLTSRGERLSKFTDYFFKHWLPKKRLLMGKYSDDLTDHFRNSPTNVDYLCK